MKKTIYTCAKCDAQFPKWEGRCRECGAWDSLAEQFKKTSNKSSTKPARIIDFANLNSRTEENRARTGFAEFDRVLGGGLPSGGLILVGGDPGVGKSTLLLQVASNIAKSTTDGHALYISGEESGEQIKQRLDRLGATPNNLQFLGDTNLETIISAIEQTRPRLAIIDSLNTIRGDKGTTAGKPSELKTAMETLMELAKTTGTPIVVIGHVTKEGAVAGPKVLEHLVDTVLYLESSSAGQYRILRAAKNRFGSTNEIGVWEMQGTGLVEVTNPSATFLSAKRVTAPGSAIGVLLQGSRVFLVEVQALVTKTKFGYPQRRATGFDQNRLQQLIAVLTKRLKLPLPYHDVHLNVVGGLKIAEPAVDLAVALAINSALKDTALPHDLVAIGEVGLQGEIRGVAQLERRRAEAARLGFPQAIIPRGMEERGIKSDTIFKVGTLANAVELIF